MVEELRGANPPKLTELVQTWSKDDAKIPVTDVPPAPLGRRGSMSLYAPDDEVNTGGEPIEDEEAEEEEPEPAAEEVAPNEVEAEPEVGLVDETEKVVPIGDENREKDAEEERAEEDTPVAEETEKQDTDNPDTAPETEKEEIVEGAPAAQEPSAEATTTAE